MTGALDPQAFQEGLTTRWLGRSAEFHASVGSTNELALARCESGSPRGHLIVADEQTAGRGRRGRDWHSPPGVALYASLVLRPSAATFAPLLIVAALGVGIAEGLRRATRVDVGVKWPNDLWIGRRKLGGVLVETRVSGAETPGLAAGFGLNVLQQSADFPPALRESATSLALAAERVPDRLTLLCAVLAALEPRLDEALGGGPAGALREAFRAHSVLLGRRVSLLDGDDRVTGVVQHLDATEGMVILSDRGVPLHVRPEMARDVRLA